MGGRYLINRRLSLEFGYLDESRDTSPRGDGGNEYDDDILFIRLIGRL